MTIKIFKRVTKRYLNEIKLDYKNKNFGKIYHSFKILPKQIFLNYPRNISIEPINVCNLNCDFCSSPPDLIERPRRAMTLNEFKQTIDKIKNHTHHIWLFLAGEPFLNPHFPEMVSYANRNNLHTTTSSNANLIDESTAEKIVASGLDKLIVSLDGADNEIYQKMRRGGDFYKVINAINFINNEKTNQKKLKPQIELQFIFSKINQHQKDIFKEIARDLKVDYAIKSLGIPSWILSRKQSDNLAAEYLPDSGKSRYDNQNILKRDFACSNVQRSFILADGTVCICCYDIKGKYKMGNIFKQNFNDIWNSKRYKSTRKLMKKRMLPLCKVCGETNEL